MLAMTHAPADGTIIEGTSKGDGTAAILKAAGWKWGRSITAWYLPFSRDRAPQLARIDRTVAALRDAGYDVETDIDTTFRAAADAHRDRDARLTDRAEALAAKAESKADAAADAHARHDRACDSLPPGGEPVKIGHHSENRHSRALDRAHTTARAARDADTLAAETTRRAAAAARSTEHRYNPAVIHRRLERQSAELRSIDRQLTTYEQTHHNDTDNPARTRHIEQLRLNKAELESDIEYWTAVRAEQDAQDGPKLYSRTDLRPGYYICCHNSWYRVRRRLSRVS